MNRHAVTPYGRGAGSSRVRVFSWLDRTGFSIRPHSYLSRHDADPRGLVRRPGALVRAEAGLRSVASSRPDWLLLHREASPLSRGGLERRLLSCAAFAVYDLDDALYADVGEGKPWRRAFPKAPKAVAAAQMADRVVAGNAILADWASGVARDVTVVPSCVDVAAYRAKTSYAAADPPRLVWIGSADNEVLLAGIAGPLSELHRRHGTRLTLIGTTARSLGALETMIDRVPWSESAQHKALARGDVGLMPLDDDPYSRGKCGYKLLQYAAAGLPAVASPVGTNAAILNTLGLPAARNDAEWLDALTTVIELAPADRAALGRRARQKTETHFSYAAWLPRWEQAVGLTEPATRPDPRVVR
jgi:glycosyltransferase involved in cell wall biosynthesis